MRKVLIKVALWIFLPAQKAQRVSDNFPPLPYVHKDLLMHFKTDIS
jgi:hypothetical protein